MPDTLASAGRSDHASTRGFLPILVTNLVLGVPAYFISFLFAYGFEDQVGVGNHVAFLVLITIFATVTGVLAMALPLTSGPRPSAARRAAFGIPMSLALNLAVVGVGSIVSATHKEENSVSVDFSTTTDVLVAAGLFGAAIALAAIALRVDLRPRSEA
jgi:hypothetical protein